MMSTDQPVRRGRIWSSHLIHNRPKGRFQLRSGSRLGDESADQSAYM